MRLIIKNNYDECAKWTADYIAAKIIQAKPDRRSTRSKICPEQVARDLANDRIRIKDIISDAIMDCKKIPTPVKEIIKDRIFYRSANTFSDH